MSSINTLSRKVYFGNRIWYKIASVKTPPTFLMEKLRSIKRESRRAIEAIIEAIPTVVKAIGDCSHKQAIPNPKKFVGRAFISSLLCDLNSAFFEIIDTDRNYY